MSCYKSLFRSAYNLRLPPQIPNTETGTYPDAIVRVITSIQTRPARRDFATLRPGWICG